MTQEVGKDWTRSMIECAALLAETTLNLPFEVEEEESLQPVPKEGYGAYVALVSEAVRAEVGITADDDACQSLGKALFASDDPLPESDVVDSIGELANIFAGALQGGMAHRYPGLSLGLPLVVRGQLRATEEQATARIAVRFGEVRAWLLVLRPRGS
jgi:hypothetical protein